MCDYNPKIYINKFVPTYHHCGRLRHTHPNCFDILHPWSPKIMKRKNIRIKKSKLNNYPQFPKICKNNKDLDRKVKIATSLHSKVYSS